MMPTVYLITLLIVCAKTSAQTAKADVEENEKGHEAQFSFPPSDPRFCLDIGRRTDFPLKRFSSLPGIGWDNLRNEPEGQIYDYTYAACRTSDDGRYLIPDNVFTIPIKSSQVEMYSELYESSNNVTSITSRSINVEPSLKVGRLGVSGSYSLEHTRFKQKLVQYNSVAARTQLRYLRYLAQLQPGFPLHSMFRERLFSIAADLYQNMTQSAFYRAQLLTRDYGTHVLTRVVAGAGFAKTDFLNRNYIALHESDKRVVTASASSSFADAFKMKSEYRQSTTVTQDTAYKNSMTYSYITTHGGPIYQPYNMTVTQWVNDVDSEMVPMDRSGDPLYFIITPEMFPGLPVPLVEQLRETVEEAIIQYFEMNTIRGCTKRGSPNFSYAANLDDGSCIETQNNLTFGGVYQTCRISGSYVSSNPCSGMIQVNPLTKGNSCPSGYTSVLLHSGDKLGRRESTRHCRRCGFLKMKKCCDTRYHQARGYYSTYWCAATGTVGSSSGYLFGGTWSHLSTNMVTKAKKCPPLFIPLRLLQEYLICVSNDYELAEPHAVPFGGFSSCSVGNPLALLKTDHSDTNSESFMEEPSNWPKRCPEGFSQHLVAIDDGCEIRYCIKTGALSSPDLPPIRRPPFSSKPETISQSHVFTIINSDNSIQEESMVVPEKIYDQAMEGKRITSAESSAYVDEESGTVGPSSSSLLIAITMVFLVLNKLWTQ